MDRFHFIIDDIKTLIVFNKHDKFNTFVNDFSVQRWKYLADRNPKENFFKISLNGSYGYDAMNTENYSKSYIQSAAKASCSKLSDNFKNIRQLADDVYQVDMNSDTFKCSTCIHQAYFTLDNAKYWYLVFVYEFMYKCMDMNRIHFIHGDTDAFYWAVAGKIDDELGNNQGFKHVIIDRDFYDQNVFKFLPHDAFCFNENYRPTFNTKIEAKAHEKKLLGLAIEKQGDNLIALGPKCYTAWDNEGKYSMKNKGVKMDLNKHINHYSYKDIVMNGGKIDGQNVTLQMKNGKMSRITVNKTALTGKNNKGYTCANGCIMPYVHGAKYEQ
jgi:hypothetical protein